MASSTLAARWQAARAAAPGSPASSRPAAAQNRVERMPSVRFSPTLSTQARATPWASSCCGSRPTSMDTARRAASRSPCSSGRATRRACSSRQRGARQRETTTTQTLQAAAPPSISPASRTGSAASRPTGRTTARQAAIPASVMRGPLGPRRKTRSMMAARAPMPQTGWMRAGGSPSRRSSSRAAGRRRKADSALIAMLLMPPWPLPGR